MIRVARTVSTGSIVRPAVIRSAGLRSSREDHLDPGYNKTAFDVVSTAAIPQSKPAAFLGRDL
jgi:hypothetical protein